MESKFAVLILAGGKGTRMEHELPKALVPVGGKPMVERVLDAVLEAELCEKPIVIVGHQKEKVQAVLGDRARYIVQEEQLGTGHAVAVAMPTLIEEGVEHVLVVYSDQPFVRAATLRKLAVEQQATKAVVALITISVPDFDGPKLALYQYGHILRDPATQAFQRCIEFKDATQEQREIGEVNAGYYCFDAKWLVENLPKLEQKNASGEYYLTDLMGLAVSQGERVLAIPTDNWIEGLGANTIEHIAIAEQLGEDLPVT